MKKRLKKKQSRLVAKWLAENPRVPLVMPTLPHSIVVNRIEPRKFWAREIFYTAFLLAQPDKDAFIRRQLAKCFLDVVASSLTVEIGKPNGDHVLCQAELMIVPGDNYKDI